MSLEDIKKMVTFTSDFPFLKFNVDEKYQKIFDEVEDWIKEYWNMVPKIKTLQEEVEVIPKLSLEAGKKAPEEFMALPLKEKATMIQQSIQQTFRI